MAQAMDDTMDGLATLLAGTAQTVHAWPVDTISPPCVIVGYPTRWDYDLVAGIGAERATYPIWYVVGRTSSTDARDGLAAAMASTGASSVKAALDGGHTFGSVDVDVDVTAAEVTELTVAGLGYLAARFDCEVIG